MEISRSLRRPRRARWILLILLLGLLAQPLPAAAEGNPPGDYRVHLPLITTNPPVRPLTSIEMIDADEAAGKLTAEQAALYRVQALMGVPELPEPYAAAPGGVKNIDATVEIERVWQQWSGFSPAGQEALRPYLVRPNHPDSRYQTAWDGSQAGGAPAADPAPQVVIVSEAANHRIAVWATSPDSGPAASVAVQLGLLSADNVLKPEEDLMGKTWAGDTGLQAMEQDKRPGFTNANPDARLDVYVVPYASPGMTIRDPDVPSASYVIISSDETAAMRELAVVHELFHVVENRFPSKVSANDMKWWREASANWAVYRFLPANAGIYTEHVQSLFDHPEWSLSRWSAASQPERLHAYGGFLWPVVFDGTSGAKMRAIWTKLADLTPAEAIKSALGSKYLELYNDFLVNNWNRPYVNRGASGPAGYDRIAPLVNSAPGGTRRVPAASLVSVPVDAAGSTYREITAVRPNLEPLSGAYYMLHVSPETRQVLVLLEDWTALGDTTASAFFRRTTEAVSGDDWPASPRTDHLVEWTEPGASSHNWRYLCRDMKDTNWEEILLTLGNASPTASRSATVKIIASTVGCRWQGTVTGAGSTYQSNEPGGDHFEEFVEYDFTITGTWLPPEAPLGICDIYPDESVCTATAYPKLSTLNPLGGAPRYDDTRLVYRLTHRDVWTSETGTECLDGYRLDYSGAGAYDGDADNRLYIYGANYNRATLYARYHNWSSPPVTVSGVPGCAPPDYPTSDIHAGVLIGGALSPHTPDAPANPACAAPGLTLSGNGSVITGNYSYALGGSYDTPGCDNLPWSVYAWQDQLSVTANLTRAPEP